MTKENNLKFDSEREYTYISSNNLTGIKSEALSPEELIKFMENGFICRTFKDTIAQFYTEYEKEKREKCEEQEYKGDVKRFLSGKLSDMAQISYDSMSRNVRNWMNGVNVPHREQLFQMCFALELDERRASQLLASISDTGIHYRNPEELVYAFGLRQRMSYGETLQLKNEVMEQYAQNRKPSSSSKENKEVKVYTRQIQRKFLDEVHTVEDLKQFFDENNAVFGKIHEAAYDEFMRMIKLLQNPEADFEAYWMQYLKENTKYTEEERQKEVEKIKQDLKKKSVEEVIEEYLRMYVPQNTSRKNTSEGKRNYTYLQRVIKKNWPSESTISKMKTKEMDVSRKVLLLLFLLTEEFEVSDLINREKEDDIFSDLDDDDEYLNDLGEMEDANDRMERRIVQLNLFLEAYGMNQLDPGSAFDCFVLYALKASYDGAEDNMGERFKSVLKLLFE
ncbi:hypothetical protein [Blautia sp. MSJ-9]|uniref:hypothetical protein n=1 Tax=Blautia sp. MSJ-9 TaxID=2841511 RepID=UPI001C0FC3F4|nr:hypothetical protein [Blautia sp. MSJ-9]MBU5679193.1 hypothetical protein [Blautia sp. MSJ-9]